MINYPTGFKRKQTTNQPSNKKILKSFSSANRGMDLENDINLSNEYYKDKKLCFITKRPTPINVVKVDYSHGAKIVDAYFEKQSTTDYNGVYKGRYIDFEAKSTNSKTSLPLANISRHQIEHLKNVLSQNGIAFFIIRFATLNETYCLDAKYVIDFYLNHDRQSIPYKEIKERGCIIKNSLNPRLDYLPFIEENYCKS